MKKVLLLVFAALVIPSVALAKPPKPAPQVKYELHGTLSGYQAYNSVGPVNGKITILVSDAGPDGKTLKGQLLTFPVDAKTAIELKHGLTTITDGDNGAVNVSAAKGASAATLQLSAASRIDDHGVKPVPTVTYVLKGTLSGYSAYNSVGPVNGSIKVLVKSAKPHAKGLKGMTLTFAVDANTKIKLHEHQTTITDGDKGIVKVRAPKAAKNATPADVATMLQTYAAKQVIDQGAPKPKH